MSSPSPPAGSDDAARGRSSVVAAAILAGGQGRRLGGANKSLLVVDGQRIIDRQLAVLRPLFERVAVVVAPGHPFGHDLPDVAVIQDRRGPQLGPLAGLDAALAWLPEQCESLVCVAADMPFLSPAVLVYLREAIPHTAQAVVPRLQDGGQPRAQPLCARYHRSIAAAVAHQLDSGKRAMHALLADVTSGSGPGAVVWIDDGPLRLLDPTLASFRNINSPDDLHRR
ncbi:MAG: molybdenum cofactor guanylyltransferase [Polyangia bacterium]